jgi:ADP-ribose pyrophosphatase YjhB (NUDIX family)
VRLFRRPSLRVVLVDHAYRVLLLHVTDGATTWWEPPGDVAHRGEDATATLLRVLREDTRVERGVRVGPCVWVSAGRRPERCHVAWLDDPNAPGADAAPITATTLGARWWTLDELAETGETFRPDRLPALAPAVVRGEYGTEPVTL